MARKDAATQSFCQENLSANVKEILIKQGVLFLPKTYVKI
jgi:hypothetical protein